MLKRSARIRCTKFEELTLFHTIVPDPASRAVESFVPIQMERLFHDIVEWTSTCCRREAEEWLYCVYIIDCDLARSCIEGDLVSQHRHRQNPFDRFIATRQSKAFRRKLNAEIESHTCPHKIAILLLQALLDAVPVPVCVPSLLDAPPFRQLGPKWAREVPKRMP